jgi:hypothetical protein
MAGDDGGLQVRDLIVQGLQLREQDAECLACLWRQRRGILFDEQRGKLANTPDTLRRYNAEFGKVPADSIHQHRSLPDQ